MNLKIGEDQVADRVNGVASRFPISRPRYKLFCVVLFRGLQSLDGGGFGMEKPAGPEQGWRWVWRLQEEDDVGVPIPTESFGGSHSNIQNLPHWCNWPSSISLRPPSLLFSLLNSESMQLMIPVPDWHLTQVTVYWCHKLDFYLMFNNRVGMVLTFDLLMSRGNKFKLQYAVSIKLWLNFKYF